MTPSERLMRETEHLRTGGLSPAAAARFAWMKLEGEKGDRSSFDPMSLGAPESMAQYLRNRLERAFTAGWDARKKWEEQNLTDDEIGS